MHNHYKLQDIHAKEFEFGVQNEKLILTTLNEVICYYNYDLTSNTVPVMNSENSKYFAHVSMEIINLLLDNIQKSSLVENEEIYFDIIANFLYKSDKNGIYGLTGLNKSNPYAKGLEPINVAQDIS